MDFQTLEYAFRISSLIPQSLKIFIYYSVVHPVKRAIVMNLTIKGTQTTYKGKQAPSWQPGQTPSLRRRRIVCFQRCQAWSSFPRRIRRYWITTPLLLNICCLIQALKKLKETVRWVVHSALGGRTLKLCGCFPHLQLQLLVKENSQFTNSWLSGANPS